MQPLARRKVQSAHRLAEFLPRDDVAYSHAAQMRLVEQGEAGGEKFAIDDALAEPRDDAKADAARQLGQRLADAAHIVRVDMLEAVAEDDPVDRPPVALRARLARVPDEFGAIGRASCRERVWTYGEIAVVAGTLKTKKKRHITKKQ